MRCKNKDNYKENYYEWKLVIEPSEEHIINVQLISVIISQVGEVLNICFCFPYAVSNNKIKTTENYAHYHSKPFLVLNIFFTENTVS